jgi:hypothetical protein
MSYLYQKEHIMGGITVGMEKPNTAEMGQGLIEKAHELTEVTYSLAVTSLEAKICERGLLSAYRNLPETYRSSPATNLPDAEKQLFSVEGFAYAIAKSKSNAELRRWHKLTSEFDRLQELLLWHKVRVTALDESSIPIDIMGAHSPGEDEEFKTGNIASVKGIFAGFREGYEKFRVNRRFIATSQKHHFLVNAFDANTREQLVKIEFLN